MVAVDGPAGSGKSTVSRMVAAELGYGYIDTGSMYRALTWLALKNGIDPLDEEALTRLAAEAEIVLVPRDLPAEPQIIIDGRDVTEAIRSPEVTRNVSAVSSLPGVRRAMVDEQRDMAASAGEGVVVEGRDVGTVVFPDAEVKVYLEATPFERARRRARDLERAGVRVLVEDLEGDMRRRDEYDTSRPQSPLMPAPDAHVIDTTDLTPEQVAGSMAALVAEARES